MRVITIQAAFGSPSDGATIVSYPDLSAGDNGEGLEGPST